MPNRLVRNAALLGKIETTYGVDAVPSGAANALLMRNVTITPLQANNIDRALIRPFLGGSEQIPGARYKQIEMEIEAIGSGTAGTAPAWGPWLRGCGFAETVTASTRVDYLPISTGFESLSQYAYDDGVQHILLGSRGKTTFSAKVNDLPFFGMQYMGIDGSDTAIANPAVTLTNFQRPPAIVDANAGDLTFGCTHSSSGAPALTGGTAVPSQGIEVDFGLAVNFNALLGGETVDITDRQAIGKISLDLTAAQEVANMAIVRAASGQSLGFTYGNAAGLRVLIFMPSVQLINPTKGEVNGKRLISYDIRINPSAGNDEFRLVLY